MTGLLRRPADRSFKACGTDDRMVVHIRTLKTEIKGFLNTLLDLLSRLRDSIILSVSDAFCFCKWC